MRNINVLDVSWMEANKTKGKEKRSGTFFLILLILFELIIRIITSKILNNKITINFE